MEKNISKRQIIIIKTSVIAIITNIFLSVFKAITGIVTGSVAIIMDAVNNLSDALSSIVTIIGAGLAGKAPDKKHPLGHGRVEYISQTIVAAIIIYAGITAFIESIKKIINPVTAKYSYISVIIMVIAIIVKIILGTYVSKKGNNINSGALIASGKDALFDAVITGSVLITAFIFILTGISLEAYVGLIISLFIIKSGIEIILEAVDNILGIRVQSDITKGIRKSITEIPEVYGTYDILLHNYGPDKLMGSLHIEVDDTMTAGEIDSLTRKIQEIIYVNYNVIITTVGIYSRNTCNDESLNMRTLITEKVMNHDGILQLHGFYIDEKNKDLRFDIIIDFSVNDREALYKEILEEIKALYPNYTVNITNDVDVSD